MAIIPLRVYNREIEGMVENGQLDEAVAHCRHILATFPKHIASYRLMGKAYLEQQRISDATDIFQRVLSVVPDDFIANVGMSIIREDENNLDAAIWHMELAYEAQPANAAIQDELRRLYGRRDGMQPPKVRLTRGALARMYAKGGLFDQAIAELRAAINEEPNRTDLQLLLAQMFFQTSQRIEAVEVCVNVLKKIPYCLEANRILAVCLPQAGESETIKNYRQIVISMDPYYSFAAPEAISSDQVPDNAVNIERLEWKSGIQVGEVPAQPTWATSLGVSVEKPRDENMPDWMKPSDASVPEATEESTSPRTSPFVWDTQEVANIITDDSKSEGEIPDWMKEAGWQAASSETSQAPIEPKSEQPVVGESVPEEMQKADIPEWLRGIAPEGVLGTETPPTKPADGDLSMPWLEPRQPGPTDSVIQWLEDKKPEQPPSPPEESNLAVVSDEEIPDWLKDLDLPQAPSGGAEKSAGSAPAFTVEPSAFTEEAFTSDAITTPSEQPFQQPVGEQPAPAESPPKPAFSGSEESVEAFAEEIPDWIKDLAGEQPGAEVPVSAPEGLISESPELTQPEPAQPQPGVTEEEFTPESTVIGEELPVAQEAEISQVVPEAEIHEAAPESLEAEQVPATVLPEPIEELQETEQVTTTQLEAPEELATVEAQPISEEVPAMEFPTVAEELPETEAVLAAEPAQAAEEAPIAEEVPAAAFTEPAAELSTAEVVPPTVPEVVEEIPTAEAQPVSEEVPATELPIPAEELPTAEIPTITEEPLTMETPLTAEEAPIAELPTTAEEISAPEQVIVQAEQLPSEQLLPAESEVTPVAPGSMNESDAVAWLEGLAAQQGAKEEELTTPPETHEVTPPEWVKLEAEPPSEEPVELKPTVEEAVSGAPTEEIPEWIKGLGEVPETQEAPKEPAAAVPLEVEAPKSDELPSWLLEMEQPEAEKEITTPSEEALEWKSDELPSWLKEITESAPAEAAPAEQPAPPTEQQPAVPVEPVTELAEEITPPSGLSKETLGELQPEAPAWVPEVEEPISPAPVIPAEEPAAPVSAVEELVTHEAEVVPVAATEDAAKQEQAIDESNQVALTNARTAISQRQSSQAIDFYTGLIKQNYHLDEIIKDLQDALYQFPVDVDMWVTLGDAHFRANELQEALNAYTKAEELVR